MADFEVEGSIVQVKKCTVFIGSNSSGKSEIVKLLLKTLDDQCDPDEELKWIQAVTLTKDGECRPIGDNTEIEAVQNKMKDDSCFSLTCSILIDAEGLKEVPIPKCHVSSLATGLGGYFIVFPLDSFAEEASDDSKAKLVEEIFESMHVIKESVPRTAPEEIDKGLLKPQVVLVGTHHGSDAPKASNWREVANDRLKRKLNGNEAHYNLMLKDGSRDVVWDVDVTDKDENSTLSTPLPSVSEVDFPMEFSWMEAYKILGGIFKKRTNKRLSKNQCLQFFRKKKLQIQNLDKMLSVFNLLGWFVTHDNAVFDRSYLCAKIQKLVRQGKIPDGEEIGELLANKGLATKCAGEYVITCMLPERADQNPRISASLLYLTVEHGHVMSVDVFWKLVNEVLKVKHWETRSPPTCSNYITLQYHTLFVHLTYIDGVIEVAVEKPIQARGSEAKSLKRFADNCGKIRESLIGSLENLKGDRCKWGFACNEDHLIGDYNPCLSRCVCVTRSDTFNPNEYLFKCHFDKHPLPALTLRHEVWFTTKLLGSHHLVEDKGIWTVPESVEQPPSGRPSRRSSFDSDRFDHPPSDAGLLGVVKMLPDSWNALAISLGVPFADVTAFSRENLGGLLALQYWRDGKSGQGYDNTWTFLLKKVSENNGSTVADDLKKEAMKNYPSWWKLGSTGSSEPHFLAPF